MSSNPSLSVSIVAPASAVVGQYVTITVQVTNNGSVNLTNIQSLNFTTGVSASILSPVSTPVVMASLASGQSTSLTYVYSVISAGTTAITSQAEGTNVTANDVQSPAAANGPFAIALSVATPTSTPTPFPTLAIFKIMTPTPGGTPLGAVGPNPNSTPGQDRTIFIEVSQTITKMEIKIYSKAGRLVRYYEDSSPTLQGTGYYASAKVTGDSLAGLARGVYYLVITVTGTDGSTAKSSIEKILIQ